MAIDKQNRIPNVPTLRFPGFTGEWQRMKLGELLEFFSTNSLSWEQLDYEGEGIKNLHYGLIHVGLPTLVDIEKESLPYIKPAFLPRNYELVRNGDIAFADASEDTKEVAKAVEFINLSEDKVIFGLHTIHGRDKNEETVPGFKAYYFSSPAFHNQVRHLAQGTKIYSVSTKILSECKISIPSKAEQSKIVTLLKLLDERISTQSKIIEKLESLISGLNNHLDSLYGNRFTVSFSEIAEEYNGLSGKSSDDFGMGEPYISYVQVNTHNEISYDDFPLVIVGKNENQNKVENGDLLVTLSSETPKEVAVCATYNGNESPIYLNSFCFGLHFKNNAEIYPLYFSFFTSTMRFRKHVYPLAQGSTRYNLNKQDFLKMHFKIPSLNHQIQIYNLLNLYAKRIEIEKKLLQTLFLQKEHLLCNLFI